MVTLSYPSKSGNTLSNPQYLDDFNELRKFDFIVMNPPFSDKSWTDGIKTTEDKYKRFDGYGIPPEKNGDYAWFLHVLKSLNAKGKAGIVMPHGILFRGNSEETIRLKILEKKYIKAIVSLPANLFYGTGIPACIVIIDKEDAESRDGIFMIDASRGYKKDGSKNRLREQDIEKIVQTFTGRLEIPGYSRFVKYSEIMEQNAGNLNVPRYIQKIDDTLPQNIAAHLKDGIPGTDVESLKRLWDISPALKQNIFTCIDAAHNVYNLALPSGEIEGVIGQDASTGVFAGRRPVCAGFHHRTHPVRRFHRRGGTKLHAAGAVRLLSRFHHVQARQRQHRRHVRGRAVHDLRIQLYDPALRAILFHPAGAGPDSDCCRGAVLL